MATPEDAIEFLRLVAEAESVNRQEAIEDIKFRYGDQWPLEMQNSRTLESRPCLTMNEVDAYCRQVINGIRQQRPRIKVHPVSLKAVKKTADVITGIMRHIEVNSDADNAYDTAADYAVTGGFGYWRINYDYIHEGSFDQDIYIQAIDNPFTVYFDPNSVLPDGSDAEKCLITDTITKDQFRLLYPDAQFEGFSARASGDVSVEWVTKETIRLAEYFYIEKKREKLLMLSDGSVKWKSELADLSSIKAAGLSIIKERESFRRVVKWCKVTAFDVLEQKEWAGRWIPVVPVYGATVTLNNAGAQRKHFGMVRFAKDPQRMVNFWQTSMTESIALAPKAKWLVAEGTDEGYENEWARANIAAFPVLHYKQTDVAGNSAPPPQRIQPEPPPSGQIEAANIASISLQKVLGMFDPAMRSRVEKSGKAVLAEQQQSDNSNFHFYDNVCRSIKHTGRICLDLSRKIYDTERVMRIIGEDEKPDLVTINERVSFNEIKHDVTVSDYDVVIDTGPGYNSKRQEAVNTFSELLRGPLGQKVAEVGADLVIRTIDAPGMDILADRLAAANPLSKIDDNSDIPPAVQMLIQQQQAQLEKAHELLQKAGLEIKFKTQIERDWMETELKKEKMRQETVLADSTIDAQNKRHNVDTIANMKRHDTETRALTAQNVEELKGMVQLLLHHLDTKQLKEMAAIEDEQLRIKSDYDREDIAQ